jgi:uncharacterized protein YkwD
MLGRLNCFLWWSEAMKALCQLEAVGRYEWVVWLVGILGGIILAFALPAPAQTNSKPDEASPQGTTRGTPSAPKHEFPTGGVWHHFGEKENASVAPRREAVRAYSLGATRGTSRMGSGAASQNFGAGRMAGLERQMWVLVNQDRLKPGSLAETGGQASPLKWNDRLAAVARAHSLNMLKQRSFSHDDPDGTTFSARIKRAGIPWEASGENIAVYDTVEGAESAFMNEPRFQQNHRGNILNATYTDVGIGVVEGPDGSLYITQDFVATPLQGEGARNDPPPARAGN